MRDPVETLLERTAHAVAQRQNLPEATCRLQFSACLCHLRCIHLLAGFTGHRQNNQTSFTHLLP